MSPDAIVWLGSVAAIGLFLKAILLFHVEIKDEIALSFVLLCLLFIVQNAAEFLGYFTLLDHPETGELFLHIYMVAALFVFPSVLLLAMAMGKSRHLNRARIALYSVSTGLTLLYMAGWVVSGVQFTGWTVITEPGPLYWIAMGFLLICCLVAPIYLFWRANTETDYIVRYNCRVNLIAICPLVFVVSIVLLLRVAGFESSAAISMPAATMVFLYIIVLHTRGDLFWISTKLASFMALLKIDKSATVREVTSELEKVFIVQALKMTCGNQSTAARLLKIPAPTLNKRIKKYGLDLAVFEAH